MAELSGLAIFVDVVRCRSFSRAAERHGVSQSAASQRVSQLEKSLGVKLLDRSVRPPALTEPGRVFYEGCAEIVQRYDALADQVARASSADADLRGAATVRVRAIYSAGIAWLGRVRAGFAAAQPGGPPDIEYGSPEAVYQAVAEGAADVGIVSFPELLRDQAGRGGGNGRHRLAWRPLRDEAMAVVCPLDHPWARESAVSARHLGRLAGSSGSPTHDRSMEMLGFEAQLPVGRAIDAYLARHGVRPRITHRFDNLDTLKSAVLDTGRPAILPRRSVDAEVAAGRLAAVALRPAMVRPIAALYRVDAGAKRDDPPAALVPLLEHLAAHAEPDGAESDSSPALRSPRASLLANPSPPRAAGAA